MSRPKAIFIGMPGVGKSAVGRRLAARLGVSFADSDVLIRQATGASVAQVIAQRGEAGFRELEAQVIAKALANFTGVLSLGGGAILHPATRALLENQRVILIETADDILIERLTNSPNKRPLIASDIPAGIARLRAERNTLYRQIAKEIVISDRRPIDCVVDEVVQILEQKTYTHQVSNSAHYTVTISNNLTAQIVAHAAKYAAVFIINSIDVTDVANNLAYELETCGKIVAQFVLPAGETAKELSIVEQAWEMAGRHQIGRDAVVLSVGGGATTDAAGFIAATWLRGIPVIHVPTTLLAMVDAAIGGKTGINNASGKNLVGAFHSPIAVYSSLDTLSSLPTAELIAGMAEIIKCGFIADRSILELIAHTGPAVLDPKHPQLLELISRAVEVKCQIVSQDLHENGLRELLNYGHTLAHVLEKHSNYTWKHGQAVAVGAIFAAAVSELAGIAPAGFTALHRNAFASLHLPITYPSSAGRLILAAMYNDKKVRAGNLRFVILKEIAEYQILTNPPLELLEAALERVGITFEEL